MTANIGIHFIDMLHWIFGPAEKVVLHHSSPDNPMSPYRHLVINGEEFDFTNGFTDLHTLSYERILAGRGFAVEDTACAVHTLDMLRKSAAVGLTGDYHPLLRNLQG